MNTEMMQPEQQKQPSTENHGEMTREGTTFIPRVDIWENDEAMVLFADMPGVESGNLDIQFEDRQLTIHGRVEPRQADLTFVAGEYSVGDFYRTFTIGESVDVERIEAELKDGVLKLQLPKSEAAKPRKIEVKAG